MQRKTFNLIETKADGAGNFTALASVFGNVDSVGDRMMPGSFSKTLERWRESGDPIPVILSHNWDDPFAMVGKADPRAVYEDERGLVVQGSLDLDNEVARQVHKLMKDRLLKGWSFGYTIPKGGQKAGKDGANEVNEVDLVEVGPTLKGANSEARLEEVKSALHSANGILVPAKTTAEVETPVAPPETPETPEETPAEPETPEPSEPTEEPEAPESPPPPEAPAPPPADELRTRSRELSLEVRRDSISDLTSEPVITSSLAEPPEGPEEEPAEVLPFPPTEVFGASTGLLKAAWTISYVDSLPDHAFLLVRDGGVPDWEGKTTPRHLRQFPYRDHEGKLDPDHLRVAAALGSSPDTDLPKSIKQTLVQKAKGLLDEVELTPAITGAAPTKVRARDPLRRQSLDVALDIQSNGRAATKPPPQPPPEPAEDLPERQDLRRDSRAAIMSVLTE